MTENGGNGTSGARHDGRDIATAVGDAIGEHERWLRGWHRAAICGTGHDDDVLAQDAHGLCRFGRWFADNSTEGMLDNELIQKLEYSHRELHAAGSLLAVSVRAGKPVSPEEYDTLLDASDAFMLVARRVCETYGPGDGADAGEDDPLSDLHNRLNMLAELERERDRSLRTGLPTCLVMMRPDGLAMVGAEYGQVGVDRVLASLATRLFVGLRPYDAVYRYSSDEILICLPGADAARSGQIVARLIEAMEASPIILSDTAEVTISAFFGIAAIDSGDQIQKTVESCLNALASTSPEERTKYWPLEKPQ